jgi:GT2 family glycosyltransferase
LAEQPSISVGIVTWRRPDYLRKTLEHLAAQRLPVEQVIVVVAPSDPGTAVVDSMEWVTKVASTAVAGHRTQARNEALLCATGEVIAFLDDDAYARPDWSANLAAAFTDPSVAAVAGRTCDGQPGEEQRGLDEVGLLRPNGELTGNFAADTGALIDVDHGIGANMAFRRSVLMELGGFRDDFPGAALREETDLFLRIRVLGRRVVFAPGAVVDHVGAPHMSGKRFDWRYMFWGRHNHVLLLARNYGLASPLLRRWLVLSVGEIARVEGPGGRLRRFVRRGIGYSGVAAGLATSLVKARPWPRNPRRRDAVGKRISDALG